MFINNLIKIFFKQNTKNKFSMYTLIIIFAFINMLSGCNVSNNNVNNKDKIPVEKSTLTDTNNTANNKNKSNNISYKNNTYGFNFILPESFKGFKILHDTWYGYKNTDNGDKTVEKGPIIIIRNPLWTKDNPYQDIPIMIFTNEQWDQLQNGDFFIGAAPIGPTKLNQNNKYTFALPARYNFAFPKGYEEVEKIINNHPLTTFNVK